MSNQYGKWFFDEITRPEPTPSPDKKDGFEKDNAESAIFKEKFEAQDYIKNYYPEQIDIDKFSWAIKKVQDEISQNDGRINIESIVEKTNLPHETVENIVIFDFQKNVAGNLLEAYPQNNIKVLDVDGGPTIYQHILTSLEAGSITHSEFLEQNREEVNRWLNQEEDSYNWDAYFSLMQRTLKEDKKYMSILHKQAESDDNQTKTHAQNILKLLESETIEGMKNHLRTVVSSVIHGNVFEEGLELNDEEQFEAVTASGRESNIDLLTSNFTIESATSDRATWEKGMKNIIDVIKSGGFLSLSAIRSADWYQVEEEQMPATNIDENDISSFLEENDFKIIEISVLEGSDKETVGYDGMVFVFAKKLK